MFSSKHLSKDFFTTRIFLTAFFIYSPNSKYTIYHAEFMYILLFNSSHLLELSESLQFFYLACCYSQLQLSHNNTFWSSLSSIIWITTFNLYPFKQILHYNWPFLSKTIQFLLLKSTFTFLLLNTSSKWPTILPNSFTDSTKRTASFAHNNLSKHHFVQSWFICIAKPPPHSHYAPFMKILT